MRYLILFLFLISNSNSYASDIIGTKLICTRIDNFEVGYYFNRPNSLIRYNIPVYYPGITEKELRSVGKNKRNYNPSPLRIYIIPRYGESNFIDRTNLNLIHVQRNQTYLVD